MAGQVTIITGASSGIGAAAAEIFAAKGYRVVLAARRRERLEQLAAKIHSAGGEAYPVPTDVSQFCQLQALVDGVLAHYGQIDVLINNAGIGRLRWLDELNPEDDIVDQITVNLTAGIQLTRLVLPHFRARGKGHIVNVSSAGAWLAIPTYSVYTATKFGMRGFNESLRRELRGTNIFITGIYPGAVDTEFDQHAGVEWEINQETPSWLLLSKQDTAARIFQAVKKQKKRVVTPWVMHFAIWAEALAPGLVDWVLGHYFQRGEDYSLIWGRKE